MDHIGEHNTARFHLNKFDMDWIDIGMVEDAVYILILLPHHTLEEESAFQHPYNISQTDEYRC
jgi:hypothetical protein